ncbi:MAG: PAS domain-containing sensor histidine kinase [Melioribacteraceae bacterium]|nr:PAS domain-containing sensor histidine kinase [Melioribacteraceae bacterium]MCF8356506.1 PAS domain-containing sensor histidine kinase [Melioribacteraceae bacterium]MCF8395894.1 PAS domain-containing sensor histidine kinase [Melioribacteraceae bacterium]MCF8420943.1 PAS domain-containing sensor histidine kinase [Melioribacteraceae bacterium]
MTKILELINKLCRSSFSYVIKADTGNASILDSCGNLDMDQPGLAVLNKELSARKNISSAVLKKLKSYKSFAKANSIKSCYADVICSKGADRYLLLIFSKRADSFSKAAIGKIKLAQEIIAEQLHADKTGDGNLYYVETFKNVHIPFIVSNLKNDIKFSNPAFYEVFDINKTTGEENILDFIVLHDEKGEKLDFEQYPFVRAAREKKSVTDEIYKIYTQDNNDRWIRAASIYISDEESPEGHIVTGFWDITKMVKSELYFKEATKSIQSVLFSTDSTGSEYYFITKAVQRVFGYSPEDVYNNRFVLIRRIYPEYFFRFKEFVRDLQNGKERTIEYKLKDKFNNDRYVRHSGIPIIENKRVVRIVGIIYDITNEKMYQEKLTRSEEKFRMLVETADDLIFSLNSAGYFVMVNENGALSLGHVSDEMIGRHFLEFVPEEDKPDIAVAFQKILGSDNITTFEANFIDKFGNKVIFEIQARPTKTDGQITGMLGIGRDITKRLKDESKLRELNQKIMEANRIISIERDRAKHQISVLEELNTLKNDFVSNVSHELRTPLASIVGFAETIVSDPELPREMIIEFNEIILTESKRLARFINDVLDFSKLESGVAELNKSNFDLIELYKEIALSFKKQSESKGIAYSVEIPEAEFIINGDKERLSKAFSNIIANAIKFTKKGGRISVVTQTFLNEVEMVVSDTGTGIPQKDVNKVFEKFYKNNRAGTQIPGAGIGLAQTKKIIDLHKGLIQIKSELDRGTSVIIRLPKN